ncbi:hypothetical protein Csa_010544, partial [Cucumis sativus]
MKIPKDEVGMSREPLKAPRPRPQPRQRLSLPLVLNVSNKTYEMDRSSFHVPWPRLSR